MGTSARIEELRKKFEENPRRYFAPLANEYRKAGDLEQAIEICRQHLAEQPGHMSGHIVFGQALFEAGQLEEAGQIFSAALALDPENLIALRHLGDIARGQGDARTAQAWYQRVLDADPRNDEIAALVREMAAAVPLEGFAGIPADGEPVPATGDAPEAFDAPDVAVEAPEPFVEAAPFVAPPTFEAAPTVAFAPPRFSDAFGEVPSAPPSLPEAADLLADEAVTAETPAFEPLVVPEASASVVLPASALPPERIVEPLPNTIEIPQVDVQQYLEASRRPTPAVPFEPVAAPPAVEDDVLEMPTAEELRHPPEAAAPADPLADLPMEMLEGFGEASAESLLSSGRAAPAPESPLANLEAAVGDVEDAAPLIGGAEARPDAGLEFMDNPLSDLATKTPTPSPTASALDAFPSFDDGNALAPEPPLPPPVVPAFEPVDSEDLAAAPRLSGATPRISEPVSRVPTPVASPTFVTESMGEVLEQQGLYAQAAEVYRTLLAERPGDANLAARLAAVEAQVAPAGWTAREWLQQLAAVRLPTPRSTTPVTVDVVATVAVASVSAVVTAPDAPEEAPVPVGAASLEQLFGPPSNSADESAALALAALYDETAAIPGAPTAPANDELSLKSVFDPPAAPAPRTSAAFSFDQFFAAAPKAPTPAPGGGDAELAEFTRWLDGLKKQ